MSDSTLRQVAQLSKLSFPELQERWRSLLGTEPPAYHQRFLVKRLAYRIQEFRHGGLAEKAQPGPYDHPSPALPLVKAAPSPQTTPLLSLARHGRQAELCSGVDGET